MEYNDKFLMKAWNHKTNKPVVTTGAYKGECDHPDFGTVVFVEFENKDCHLPNLFTGKYEDVEVTIPDFHKMISQANGFNVACNYDFVPTEIN